jgi:hypothetical protein
MNRTPSPYPSPPVGERVPTKTGVSALQKLTDRHDIQRRLGHKASDLHVFGQFATVGAAFGAVVVVNGVWFYASKEQVLNLINGQNKACTFHTIQDDLAPAQ